MFFNLQNLNMNVLFWKSICRFGKKDRLTICLQFFLLFFRCILLTTTFLCSHLNCWRLLKSCTTLFHTPECPRFGYVLINYILHQPTPNGDIFSSNSHVPKRTVSQYTTASSTHIWSTNTFKPRSATIKLRYWTYFRTKLGFWVNL